VHGLALVAAATDDDGVTGRAVVGVGPVPLRHTREADRRARAERAARAAQRRAELWRGRAELYRLEIIRLEDHALDALAALERRPPGVDDARHLLLRATRRPA
jgi:hypothetical protein